MATALTAASCANDNKLMQTPFDTPRGVPPFGQYYYSDYMPAFRAEIEKMTQGVALIAGQRNEPTFENTIIALDRNGEKLDMLSELLFNLKESDNCDSISAVAEEVMPLLTEVQDNIYMNADLFARIRTLHDKRDQLQLDSAQMRCLELYYKDFVRSGAMLSEADQAKLRDINQQLSMLSLRFSENVLNDANAYSLVIDTISDLKGVPDGVVAAAAERAEREGKPGKWVFGIQKASMIPFLRYCGNRELRKQIYAAYCNQGNNDDANDNKDVVRQMTHLRAQRAQLLGYKSHAHYVLEENMAATPEAVDSFLMELWEPALKRAKQEYQDLKNFAYRYDHTTQVEAADWWYWAEKLRKAKYDIDETELSEYFALANVRKALFDVADSLYGVRFEKVSNLPLYNEKDNETYEVYDRDQTFLGVLYMDYHPRASKGAGAWCTMFRQPLDNADGSRECPVISIVANVTAPTADIPALLTYDDVETLFHEFGHALHGFFTRGQYRRTAGNVPCDYVEMPSQFMEHYAAEPQVLKTFAKHYKTGEVIPDRLIERLRAAQTFNQGFASVEYLAASILDMAMHSIDAKTMINVEAFEKQTLGKIGMPSEIMPRYRSTYFAHCFNFDYSASYYAYIWAEVLDCDAYAAFSESGDIFNQDLAAKFRRFALGEAGNSEPMSQYVAFRGRRPEVGPLLKNRGLD